MCTKIVDETEVIIDISTKDEYYFTGFIVGNAEKSKLVTGESIEAGDVIIGLPSSGIHSNGYSLVRKIIEDLDLSQTYEGLSQTLGESLLTPTKIYAKQIHAVLENHTIKGISHITGGGFYENFPRMLPDGLGVTLDPTS